MAIVTDLNDRERRKYAEQLNQIAESARSAAVALREGDDYKALIHLTIVGLTGSVVVELAAIFSNGLSVNVPDIVPEETRG